MPIFMFDKDGAFVVMRLEQVSILHLWKPQLKVLLGLIVNAAVTIVLWTRSSSPSGLTTVTRLILLENVSYA